MKKEYRYFIGGVATVFVPFGGFLLVVFLFSLALGGVLSSDNKRDIKILDVKTSPSQKHIVTIFSVVGGCSKINIRRNEEEFDPEEIIFNSPCGTVIDTEWKNDVNLQVSYSVNKEELGMNQKGWNKDKTVKVTYNGK